MVELLRAGYLGKVGAVRTFNVMNQGEQGIGHDPNPKVPDGLDWDFWCGPSRLLPFKDYYLGGCLQWGRWFEFGDGHLADMGAHAHNLPLRALKLGPPIRIEAFCGEPVKDSYPSATRYRWDFAARQNFAPVSVW